MIINTRRLILLDDKDQTWDQTSIFKNWWRL